MKSQTFNKACALLLVLTVLFTSCKENSKSIELLKQAQDIVENNSFQAQILLDSIQNPKEMDIDHYMQYIIADIQVRYKNYQDISGDTLIFEAQKYFNSKNDPANAALANYYTASVYYEKGNMPEQELESFLKAQYYAQQVNNNLLAGKSSQSIGNLYFNRNIIDSTIIQYEHTLNFYNEENEINIDLHKLNAINMIGRAIETTGDIDKAHTYFDKGLVLASKTDNKAYEAIFTHNLGVVFRKMRDYKQAIDYFNKAILITKNPEDSLKAFINLSGIFIIKSHTDSAKYYNDLITEQISRATDNNFLQSAYNSLSAYNKQAGNYQEALHYSELEHTINEEIAKSNNAQQLLEVNKRHEQSIQQKEMEKMRMRSYLTMACGVFVILLIALFAIFRTRNLRQKHRQEQQREHEKNEAMKMQMDSLNKEFETQSKLLETQNELLNRDAESFALMENIYKNIVTDWVSINKEIKALAKEYGAEEEPELFIQIRKLIDNFRLNANSYLTVWAKNYLYKQPYGQKALELLSEKEILLFILHYCRYNHRDIATIIGVLPHIQNMDMRKLDLKNKLTVAGMPEDEIQQLLNMGKRA